MDPIRSQLQERLNDSSLADTVASAYAKVRGNVSADGEAVDPFVLGLEKFCGSHKSDISTVQLAQLRLVANILQATKGHVLFSKDVLKADSKEPRVEKLVVQYYVGTEASALSESEQRVLRLRLFEKQPTAVIAGLVSNGKLRIENGGDMKVVASVLRAAVDQGIHLRSQSIANLTDQDEMGKMSSAEDRKLTYRSLAAIQRLASVVTDPLDIPVLVACGFTSAREVATTERKAFVQLVKSSLHIDAARSEMSATAIWQQAIVIDARNQRAWSDLISKRAEIPVLAVDRSPQHDSDEHAEISLENLFRENESFDVDEWSSALSPAAYLVDLLQLLRYSYINPSERPSTSKPSELLTEFLSRRPDIARLELSASNTTTVIPYIDLVNEVLETYIDEQYGGQVLGQETDDESEADDSANRSSTFPRSHINWDVYQKIIQNKVAPPHHFPFNLASEYLQHSLATLGITQYELLNILGPYAPIRGDPSNAGPSSGLIQSSLSRRLAAAYLDLSQEDFLIITGEAFVSYALWATLTKHGDVLTKEVYQERIGLRSPGEYWGFRADGDSSANEKMVSTTPGARGLVDIKDVLLPMSGLSYADLISILKGEFFSERLIVTVESSQGAYNSKLEDMKLCSTNVDSVGPEENLDYDTCADLLSFIKLWRSLSWSIEDLDNAIITLAHSRLMGQAVELPRCIDAEMISDIAAIQELSEISGLSYRKLLPLWSPMRLSGEHPLYVELFCRPHQVQRFPQLQLNQSEPDSEHPQARIGDLIIPLLSGLRLRNSDYKAVLESASLGEQDEWNLVNVSRIYSHHSLCVILNISASQISSWLSWALCADPFASPRTTLRLVKRWDNLKQYGWSGTEILDLLGLNKHRDDDKDDSAILSIASRIWNVLQDLRTTYPSSASPDAESGWDNPRLVRVCTALFDSNIAEKVIAFVEGTWKTTSSVPDGCTMHWSKSLSRKIRIQPGTLSVLGVLSTVELEQLRALNADGATVQIIDDVVGRANVPWLALSAIIGPEHASKAVSLLDPVAETDPRQTDLEQNTRRKLLLPTLELVAKQKALQTEVCSCISEKFPNVNAKITQILLSTKQEPQAEIFDKLGGLDKRNSELLAKPTGPVKGYLHLTVTGDYILRSDKDTDFMITCTDKSYSAHQSNLTTVTLQQGQLYFCSVSEGSKMQNCQLIDAVGVPESLSAQNFLHADVVQEIAGFVSAVSKAAQIVAKNKLTEAEVEYFSKRVNMMQPGTVALETVGDHAKVRGTIPRHNAKLSLLDLYEVSGDTTMVFDLLSQRISDATGMVLEEVQSVLEVWAESGSRHFNVDARMLLSLRQTIKLMERTSLPIKTLLEWTILFLPKDHTQIYEAAKSLEAITSNLSSSKTLKASQDIATKKQTVLVQYLMTEPDYRGFKVRDIDSLFEYFLIDVQMGAQLQTSRIRQAISTVQLFIQRSLLGLEKAHGIPTTAVNRSTWIWMSKFTLWQANRKVFLYPENWADPTLRDDKSEVFRSAETAITQSNLNLETVNSIVRMYIYEANEIADLQVVTYFWEPTSGFQGKYHIFAKTRTAPYVFHHRIFHITGVSADAPNLSWYPWTRLDTDVPTYEVDWDSASLERSGSYLVPTMYKGRLFLFIPQILLRTRQKKMPKQYVMERDKPVVTDTQNDHYWDIKMGWTELRNQLWSKKEISTCSLEVQGTASDGSGTALPAQAKEMPSIKSFHFRASSRFPPELQSKEDPRRNEVVVIDVFRWLNADDGSHVQLHVGRFELRGTQIVISDFNDQSISLKPTIPTKFQRLAHKTSVTQLSDLQKELTPYAQYNPALRSDKNQQPFIAVAPQGPEIVANPMQDLIWAISYNENELSGASALLVERTTPSLVDQYFGIAMRDQDGAFTNTLRETSIVQSLIHSTAQPLMEAATNSYDLGSIFDVLENVPADARSNPFGVDIETIARELYAPYSIYNWELGFHLVLLLMERLLSTQQFELALNVASVVFDPKADDDDGGSKTGSPNSGSKEALSNLDRCWKFVPFKNSRLRLEGSTKNVVEKLKQGHKTSVDIDEWLLHPFSPHAIARTRPMIYMRRFIMKYIEILVAAGDAYFREESLESIPYALQYYVQASQLFGKRPEVLPSPTKPVTKTYNDISAELDDFSSAMVDMELAAPFFVEPSSRAAVAGSRKYKGVQGMVQSTYFRVPANPQLAALRDLIDDRFSKIRNNLDINGNFRNLPLFDPPLDPGDLVRSMASGGLASVAASASGGGPMPNYRCVHLLRKAFELCSELKSMSASYLSIKEKRDVEALSVLAARQQSSVQNLALQLKKVAREDAEKVLGILETRRMAQVMRLRYYLALIGEETAETPVAGSIWKEIEIGVPTRVKKGEIALSPEEHLEHDLLKQAQNFRTIAADLNIAASILKVLPEMKMKSLPFGFGMEVQFDPKKVADGMEKVINKLQTMAAKKTADAGLAARREQVASAYYQRKFEANAAGYEVSITDKEIEKYQATIAVFDAEIDFQEQRIKDAIETQEYLRGKYTNEALYAWMDSQARQMLYQNYLDAIAVARDAERAFLFERRAVTKSASDRFLTGNYWNDARDGAFTAESLALDLRKMETAYQERKAHDYEIKKKVSLRQLDPWALLRLQETGETEIALPEVLFDYDFPGHFCRRIKSVSLTISACLDAYSSVNCTLRLVEHGYRLRQDQKGSSTYYPAPGSNVSADSRYHTDKIPITAVALGNCDNDAGVFDLSFLKGSDHHGSFTSERYGPFEGAGVISRWALELPTEVHQFDYRSISDVVMHMSYTAMEGGALWKQDASTAVRDFQGSLETILHTTSIDLTGQLTQSRKTNSGANTDGGSHRCSIAIKDVRSRLPFWTCGGGGGGSGGNRQQPRVEFTQCYLIGTEGVGLITDLETDLPKINGNATINSLTVSDDSRVDDEEGTGTSVKQALSQLGENVQVVEVKDGLSGGSAGSSYWNECTIDLADSTSDAVDRDSIGGPGEGEDRLWMLIQYRLKGRG